VGVKAVLRIAYSNQKHKQEWLKLFQKFFAGAFDSCIERQGKIIIYCRLNPQVS
jgi:hypothetical protein